MVGINVLERDGLGVGNCVGTAAGQIVGRGVGDGVDCVVGFNVESMEGLPVGHGVRTFAVGFGVVSTLSVSI